jgi:hypothetical protein
MSSEFVSRRTWLSERGDRARRLQMALRLATTASAANATCQRCFQKGHWTFDCKNDVNYKARPSRTAMLKNPRLRPKQGMQEEAPEVPLNSFLGDDRDRGIDLASRKRTAADDKPSKKSKKKKKKKKKKKDDSSSSSSSSSSDSDSSSSSS